VVRLSGGTEDLSLLQCSDRVSDTQPNNQWVMRDLSPEVKQPGRDTTHLHLVLRLGVSGVLPPFLYAPSRRVQEELYLYLHTQLIQ
jgi:hypothetical protein